MPEPFPDAVSPRPPRRWSIRRLILWAIPLLVLVVLGREGVRVVLGSNFHEVLPRQVYRCAQPSLADLEAMVRKHGIRTVINLRGCCAPVDWYMKESRATHQLALAQEDISLSTYRLPSASEMRRLVEVFDHAEYPVLLHCRRGADRTGLAAVVARLLLTDTSLDAALHTMSPRYGHLRLGRPAQLDRFFDLYESWLAETGQVHSTPLFRRWLLEEYRGGACSCTIEPLHFPERIERHRPWSVQVRVTNISSEPWQMKVANTAGFHLGCIVNNADGVCLAQRLAGLLDTVVEPGKSIDLTVDLPPLGQPGSYYLTLDMRDEYYCWFFQAGSEPLHRKVVVR